jgi:hypothetical protein
MGREELELLKGGVVKRKVKRRLGLFIDGVGLDRATRRLERKVDLTKLVAGLTSGLPIEVARYYTLVPYEDDARQFAFLDAVERAGLEVVTKRLPPKGVTRQVSMDVHIAADLISFSCGQFKASTGRKEEVMEAVANGVGHALPIPSAIITPPPAPEPVIARGPTPEVKRVNIVVCPNREVNYALYVSHNLGVETSLADFGLYGSSDGWKGVDRWIDLSTSETIWRD